MRKLLFFHASWCPPCRFYEKQFISPLEELVGPEYIERVDAWITPQRAEKYLVDKLPTVVLLDGERAVLQRTGAVDIDKVAEWLKGGDAFD
ncbi:MAG TPA: thioredoxin family protein [Candidatus Merdisoma merdipullorum]|nr:thioredoxin family protein [Candidatus Merdisoma merdipullorum]